MNKKKRNIIVVCDRELPLLDKGFLYFYRGPSMQNDGNVIIKGIKNEKQTQVPLNSVRPFWLQVGDILRTNKSVLQITDINNDFPEPIVTYDIYRSQNKGYHIRLDLLSAQVIEFVNEREYGII